MPPLDGQTIVQFFPVTLKIGDSVTPVPGNPSRNYLAIQNQGAGAMTVVFGKRNGATVPAWQIAAGAKEIWDQRIPVQSINLYGTAATTVLIVEGVALPGA